MQEGWGLSRPSIKETRSTTAKARQQMQNPALPVDRGFDAGCATDFNQSRSLGRPMHTHSRKRAGLLRRDERRSERRAEARAHDDVCWDALDGLRRACGLRHPLHRLTVSTAKGVGTQSVGRLVGAPLAARRWWSVGPRSIADESYGAPESVQEPGVDS